MLEAECGKIPVSVPEELLRKLPRHGTPVVYTPGLDRFIFNAVKDCSYAHATELANLGYHRRCGEQLVVTSVQDYVSATGDAVRSRVQDELEAVLNDYGVAFDDNGCIKDGNRIPESAIHPSIPQNSPTRITKKAIKRVMKLFNSSRPRDQWIHYKKARACLEEDPMYTCYCFIDDICTKHQKEKRSATVCSQAKSDDESRRLLYTTDIYVLYRDQRYCFTAPNTTEGCRMLLGYLLKNHLLENNDLVFFSDGADEIRKALEKVFSFRPYKHLLDWFHVRKICYEYFTGLLKGGKGRLEENNQTRKKFFDLLWSGNFDGARAFVESLTDDQIKREASRQTLLGYLDRKQSRLYEYAVRKGLRLINTSNRVEQINNLLIAERQKKNGMSGCNIGSPALANITMLFLNNEFDGWERNHQLSYRLTKTNGETCRVEWTPELDAAWRAA